MDIDCTLMLYKEPLCRQRVRYVLNRDFYDFEPTRDKVFHYPRVFSAALLRLPVRIRGGYALVARTFVVRSWLRP